MRLFIDELAEREWIDRWGFLLFAIGGSAAILLCKALQINSVLVAAGAVIVMLTYAVVVGTGVSKLRADEAGDNCYYLGLIFTLVSLAFAIFTFNEKDPTPAIIAGFGIALATTVMGLILRVFLTQSRVDLVDAEESTRIALTEAASQVRAQLDAVVQTFAHFTHKTQQHLQEFRDQANNDIEEVRNNALSAVSGNADKANMIVEQQTIETTTATRKVTTAVTRLVNVLESHADALSEIEEKARGQAAHLDALERASTGVKAAMGPGSYSRRDNPA